MRYFLTANPSRGLIISVFKGTLLRQLISKFFEIVALYQITSNSGSNISRKLQTCNTAKPIHNPIQPVETVLENSRPNRMQCTKPDTRRALDAMLRWPKFSSSLSFCSSIPIWFGFGLVHGCFGGFGGSGGAACGGCLQTIVQYSFARVHGAAGAVGGVGRYISQPYLP